MQMFSFRFGKQRQKLEERDQEDGHDDSSDQERPEREDEKPQIVVLSRGDLTADEVALEQQRIAKGMHTHIHCRRQAHVRAHV